jgi:hypothetical protein
MSSDIGFISGPSTVPLIACSLRNSSSSLSADTTTCVLLPRTSVATANLPVSPVGRIDQRTIWLKNWSYRSQPVHAVAHCLPVSVVNATVLPSPYVHAARIVAFCCSVGTGEVRITSTSEFSLTVVSMKPEIGGNASSSPCTISCRVVIRGLTGGFGSNTSGRAIRRASRW